MKFITAFISKEYKNSPEGKEKEGMLRWWVYLEGFKFFFVFLLLTNIYNSVFVWILIWILFIITFVCYKKSYTTLINKIDSSIKEDNWNIRELSRKEKNYLISIFLFDIFPFLLIITPILRYKYWKLITSHKQENKDSDIELIPYKSSVFVYNENDVEDKN